MVSTFPPDQGQTMQDVVVKGRECLTFGGYLVIPCRRQQASLLTFYSHRNRLRWGNGLVQDTQLVNSRSGASTRVVRLQTMCSFHSSIQHCSREL